MKFYYLIQKLTINRDDKNAVNQQALVFDNFEEIPHRLEVGQGAQNLWNVRVNTQKFKH